MGAQAAPFKQADVTRALRGALKATKGSGLNVRVEIQGGNIVIMTDQPQSAGSTADIERRMREAFGE